MQRLNRWIILDLESFTGLGGECAMIETSSLCAVYLELSRVNRSKCALRRALDLGRCQATIDAGILCARWRNYDSGYHLHWSENIHRPKHRSVRSVPSLTQHSYSLHPFPRLACAVAAKCMLKPLKPRIPPLFMPLVFRESLVGL